MVPVWFVCVSRLSRQLRDRHREKYEEMKLAEMWPQGLSGWLSRHNNTRPVIALFRFLLRSEDAKLQEADISRLSSFMRRFSCVYMGVFLLLGFLIVRPHFDRFTTSRQTAV